MTNISILYYEPGTMPASNLEKLAKLMREKLDTTLIAVPKNFDVVLNCSVDQLYSVRAIIDTAIAQKLEVDTVTTNGTIPS